MKCPTASELERAHAATRGSESISARDAAVRDHVEECEACAATWSEIAALVDLGRQIEPAPAWERREEVRTTLLAGMAPRTPVAARPWRSFLPFGAALAGAAAAAVAILLLRTPAAEPTQPPVASEPARRSTLVDLGTSRYLVASAPPNEIVRLVDGGLTVSVGALAAGERFRVITGDGELDGSDAAFDVLARGDKFVSVRVMHGEVKLLASGTTRTVRAGEIWRAEMLTAAPPARSSDVVARTGAAGAAPTPTGDATASDIARTHGSTPSADAIVARTARPDETAPNTARGDATSVGDDRTPAAARGVEPPVRTTPPVDASPPAASDAAVASLPDPPARPAVARTMAQQAIDDGWAALRRKDWAGAASSFERARAVASDPHVIEDASFWRGVALARAGEVVTAAHVFTALLKAYPDSARAGEVHVMLGWLLFERSETVEARRHFEAASRDASSAVRAGAAEGMRAVTRRN